MAREALEGIRVLDISTVIAGPWGAGILADFGAEVIKVEMPGRGDAFRAMGPLKDGVSIRWPSMGRNKKSVTLDFHFEEGKKLFLELVKKSDVIIENFKTGTLDKWNLGMDVLRKANPDIIVTHVTGYGQTGPNAKLAGLGTPLQAFSGMTYMTGYPDRPPVSPPFALADYVAGLNAVIGTLMALYHRDVLKGKAQEVDISLYAEMVVSGIIPELCGSGTSLRAIRLHPDRRNFPEYGRKSGRSGNDPRYTEMEDDVSHYASDGKTGDPLDDPSRIRKRHGKLPGTALSWTYHPFHEVHFLKLQVHR